MAVSWTVTAILAEIASKRLGASELNVIRMVFSLLMLAVTLWVYTGCAFPQYMPADGWFWLSMSGIMGYAFGDYCLFNSYLVIGSRFGQLFMTLSSPFAAMASFMLLGEKMGGYAIVGMLLTITGIGMSILNKGTADEGGHKHKLSLKLPFKGVLLGLGAALGQGVG
ncbi:MAG: DMT family transporter, partial [Bacteroidaceae bacterium]|nr:DMT family transporter [Bacteroidaceae bacterium]